MHKDYILSTCWIIRLLLVIIAVSGCAPMTSVRRHAEYETTISRYNNILILPVVAKVHAVGASGKKERMYDYESHLEALIVRELIPVLEEKGFRARLLTNREIHDKKLGSSVMALRADYDTIREGLYSKVAWNEKQAFAVSKNVGRAAAEIESKMHADALLMLDYAGSSKTSGALALNFVVSAIGGSGSIEDSEHAVMVVGFVDARNGDVLWTNLSSTSSGGFYFAGNDLESQQKIDAKKLSKLISTTLNAINKGK